MERLVEPTIEFPEHFLKLERTFKVNLVATPASPAFLAHGTDSRDHPKALNTVYTFCSTRKSMATTFEVLKGSVENLIKRSVSLSSTDLGSVLEGREADDPH